MDMMRRTRGISMMLVVALAIAGTQAASQVGALAALDVGLGCLD